MSLKTSFTQKLKLVGVICSLFLRGFFLGHSDTGKDVIPEEDKAALIISFTLLYMFFIKHGFECKGRISLQFLLAKFSLNRGHLGLQSTRYTERKVSG